MEVLVFGGTTEGRLLVEWLDGRDTCDVVACTATEYGEQLVSGGRRVRTVRGPLSTSDKQSLMRAHEFACVVDATHPYATHISASVAHMAEEHRVPLVRIVRDEGGAGDWTSVANADAAAAHVAHADGNVLLTTGSKDLDVFVDAMDDVDRRLFVRVLPVVASLRRVAELGIPVSHTIAMQGPFSERLNVAIMREFDIAHVVTKRSGRAGGFEQKVAAARACAAELVVIERPHADAGGMRLEQAMEELERRYGV